MIGLMLSSVQFSGFMFLSPSCLAHSTVQLRNNTGERRDRVIVGERMRSPNHTVRLDSETMQGSRKFRRSPRAQEVKFGNARSGGKMLGVLPLPLPVSGRSGKRHRKADCYCARPVRGSSSSRSIEERSIMFLGCALLNMSTSNQGGP